MPALLSTTVLSSAAYIYSCGDALICGAFVFAAAIYTFALFILFGLLGRIKRKIVIAAAFSALMIFVMFVGQRLNDLPGAGTQLEWFMDPHKFSQIYTGGMAQVVLVFGLILGASMYYFTVIQFRAVYVFLICMCPFCLFAKTYTDIPIIYTVILVTLFFMLLMISGKSSLSGSTDGIAFSRKNLLALIGFTAVVTIISAFSPKVRFAPYREKFDELITGIQIGAAAVSGDYNEFSDSSSNINIRDNEENERIVYRIYGSAPRLIKRQCFNLYNGDTDLWGYYGDLNTGHRIWKNFVIFEDAEELYKAVGFDGGKSEIKECEIKTAGEPLWALYSAENTLGISAESSVYTVYRTEMSEYFIDAKKRTAPDSYTLKWADVDINTAFAEYFTDEAAQRLAEAGNPEAQSYIDAKNEAERYKDYILSEEVRRSCYNSDNAFERVNKLAREITENSGNDYEKAKAIERYFHGEMFIYDDNFSTADASPENFIFNTRRGVCTEYATAMTLLCREIGLNARYAEGFLCSEFDPNEKCWVLRVKNAHAFVQVWIDGYGWTDFDPTSGNIDDGNYYNATFIYIGSLAGIVALIIVFIVAVVPKIKRALFISGLRKADLRRKYILTYGRINEILGAYLGRNSECFTPTELYERSLSAVGIDLKQFTDNYSRCVYGGFETDKIDCVAVINEFEAAVKAKEKADNKNRKRRRNIVN